MIDVLKEGWNTKLSPNYRIYLNTCFGFGINVEDRDRTWTGAYDALNFIYTKV